MTQDAFSQNLSESIAATHTRANQKKSIYKKSRRWAQALPWYCDPYNPVLGECGLWMAVITQALMDALSHSSHPEQCNHKHAAIQWLTGNSKDFYFVCTLAGVDPVNVRRRAKKALVAPVQWRAEAGKGSRYEERKSYRARIKKIPSPLEGEGGAQRRVGGESTNHNTATPPPPYPLPQGEGEYSAQILSGPWQ